MLQSNVNHESTETTQGNISIPFSKLRIVKNLIIVSLTTMFVMGTSDIMATFQSSINRAQNIGLASIAVQCTCTILASFLLPKYIILKYGCKMTMIISVLMFVPFFAANYYPLFPLMMLSSVLLGTGFSLFWGSVDPYLNNISRFYAYYQVEEMAEKVGMVFDQNIEPIEIQKSLEPNQNMYSFSGSCYYIGYEIGNQLKSCNKYNLPNPNNLERKRATDENILNYSCEEKLKQMDSEAISIKCNSSNFNSTEKKHANDKDINYCMEKSKEMDGNVLPDNKKKSRTNIDSTTSLFFGFHSLIYQAGYVLSSLISFILLQAGYTQNYSLTSYADESCSCGSSYCNIENECSEHNLEPPSSEAWFILTSVSVGLGLLAAVLVMVFVDSLKIKDKNVAFSLDVLLATFRQNKKRNQLLLVPLTIYCGMMKGFYVADFTKSYISCAWGIQYVGLVTACTGTAMGVFSTVSGWLVKHFGRLPIFMTTAIFNLLLNIILIMWQPNPNFPAMFLITAGMWGGVLGIFHTQVRALYGVLFRGDEEAAFGTYQLWYCVGECLCFAYSNFICNDIKIYLLIFDSTLGIIGYLIVERSHS